MNGHGTELENKKIISRRQETQVTDRAMGIILYRGTKM
jgi:hypothetical protein